MNKLNVAIVGCGFVANDHMKAWRKVPEAEVVAVDDVSETLAVNMAKTWKVSSHYTSFSKLLERKDVNVVDICTPPHTHASLAVQAMKSNFHVVLEKPMTMTTKDAEEIVRCQESTGMKAGVIHNWLFEPTVLEASSFARKGALGDVFGVEVEALGTKYDSMTANANHWCHRFPGGRFSEMLAHPIYLIRHFLGGEPQVINVSVSKIGDYGWMKSDELYAAFQVGKKLGRTSASFNAPRDAIFVNLYGTEAILRSDVVNATINLLPRRRTSRFNKGFDSLRQASQLAKSTAKNILSVASGRWLSGHDQYIKMFANSLLNDAKLPVSAEDGYEVVKVLEETCKEIEMSEKGLPEKTTG